MVKVNGHECRIKGGPEDFFKGLCIIKKQPEGSEQTNLINNYGTGIIDRNDKGLFIQVYGRVDKLLKKCTSIRLNGKTIPLSENHPIRTAILSVTDHFRD